MKLLLQSPFHGIVSRRIMLITFTGRMSGKSFTTPVTYVRDGDMVRVFSNQRWWRNLTGGALVRLHIRGEPLSGIAEPEQDRAAVFAEVKQFLGREGVKRAFLINLQLDTHKPPSDEDIARAAQNHVVVRIRLTGT
jgi:hypothetical protein